MESSHPRFPPPWRVEPTQHGFEVRDANGIRLAHIYARDDLHQARFGQYLEHLTTDEARRIAIGIARLPAPIARSRFIPAAAIGNLPKFGGFIFGTLTQYLTRYEI
jgi:hypothetical protein